MSSKHAGIDATLIVDSAAAVTMQQKNVDLVIVGADRIARNGDTANKIGTYGLAIAAAHHGIPFYVAAPRSSFDLTLESGAKIPIEERSGDEVRTFAGASSTDSGTRAYNPAFDVTPARLITAFITEYGILQPPYSESIPRSRESPQRRSVRMKYYEFIDKAPKLAKLVIIEGTERTLAERALELLLDRALPAEARALNVDRFHGPEIEDTARIAEAVSAMPFLADRRVIVVTDAQTMKTPLRRELWEVAEQTPEGNTLVLCDLLSPRAKRPEPFGVLAGRNALRIDTTANAPVRERYIRRAARDARASKRKRALSISFPQRRRSSPQFATILKSSL